MAKSGQISIPCPLYIGAAVPLHFGLGSRKKMLRVTATHAAIRRPVLSHDGGPGINRSYKEGDIGNDRVWDNWRLEGPNFVWYFRGEPHVHIWINVADSAAV